MGSNHIFFSQIVLHVGKKLDKRFYLLVYCQEVLTANNNTCGVFRELKSLTREVYVSLLFLDVAWQMHLSPTLLPVMPLKGPQQMSPAEKSHLC